MHSHKLEHCLNETIHHYEYTYLDVGVLFLYECHGVDDSTANKCYILTNNSVYIYMHVKGQRQKITTISDAIHGSWYNVITMEIFSLLHQHECDHVTFVCTKFIGYFKLGKCIYTPV